MRPGIKLVSHSTLKKSGFIAPNKPVPHDTNYEKQLLVWILLKECLILGNAHFRYCAVGHKSHDPCFHKKYMEAGVRTFVAHCTFLYLWMRDVSLGHMLGEMMVTIYVSIGQKIDRETEYWWVLNECQFNVINWREEKASAEFGILWYLERRSKCGLKGMTYFMNEVTIHTLPYLKSIGFVSVRSNLPCINMGVRKELTFYECSFSRSYVN